LTREYDPLGKEVRTTDAQQNVASNSYDVRGRRTDAFDPDMGHWIYVYDALGELVQQTDAKSQSITMKYDLLGRMTSRTDPDLTSYWHYDKYNGESSVTGSACGKSLLNVCELRTDHGYDDKFVYDSAGRAVSEALTVGASQYVSTSGYDSASGRKIQGTYPSGVSVTYAYTALGYAWKALDGRTGAEIWRGTSRSALGKWLQFVHGNGVSTTNTYFPDGLVNTAQTGAGSAIESFMYAYDKNGNLSNRMDLSTGVSSSYAYDELNRLTGETRSGASLASAQTIAWTFDAIGNMTSRTEGGVTNTYNYNSSGVGSLRPHAVADVSGAVNDALVPVYNYDANGNMTGGGGRTVAWTTANMVQSLSKAGKVVSFLYGPERERVQEVLTLNGSAQKTTIYMNPKAGAGLWYEDESGVAGIEKRHYVSVDGMTVAVIICRATPCTNTVNTATQYWHNDHLGSLTAVTDAGGGISERMAYEPFGKRRNVDGRTDVYGTLDPATGRGFTQHEHIDEVGLINMNGRVFDPALGRFMSADPNVPHPDQTQSYNRYSYVQNNPLAMVDPTGFADLPVGVGDTQTGTGGTCSLWCYSPINWLSQLFGIKPGGDAATYGSGQPNDASSTGDSSNERNLQSLMEGERGNRFRDIHHRFDAASRNRDIKAMTAIVNEYIDLYGNYWNPEASMGLVRMGNMLIRAEHDAGMDVDPQVIRAASAGLLASGMVAGIGPDLRGSGGAAKGESLIYRAASGTPASMTPRVVDAKGLSAADSLANALPGKNQVIDTSKFKSLCAICDNPATGHVSITPKDMSQMQGWINSRGGAEIHPFTQELMDAVIGTVKK
jgi:RHS repeat-associated protein